MTRGSWVLHFDDDDALRPDAIATLLELARGSRAEVAYGGYAQHRPAEANPTHGAFPPREGEIGWQGALVHGGLRFFERELVAADLGVPGDAYLLRRMLRTGVRFVVFDNGRLGMVKLEQEQGGLPEFGTVLANPDLAAVARAIGLHGVRVEGPDELDGAVQAGLAHPGPVLLDVITNPDEISLPPRVKVADGWGFAIAKLSEELHSA
jgi:hypothetical protein